MRAIDGRKTSGGRLLCADRSEAKTRTRTVGERLRFTPYNKKDILTDILFVVRAIDGARTRGLDLGKVARYQLRHYRIYNVVFVAEQIVYYQMEAFLSTTFLNFLKIIWSCPNVDSVPMNCKVSAMLINHTHSECALPQNKNGIFLQAVLY